MGPNIARSRSAPRRHSGSLEIRIPVRRRDAVVNHKRTDRESTSGKPNGNRRQLVWAADSVLSADGARSNSCFQLCSEGADSKHDEGPGFGSRRSPIHVSRQQRYPQCAFRFQLVILFDWSPCGFGFRFFLANQSGFFAHNLREPWLYGRILRRYATERPKSGFCIESLGAYVQYLAPAGCGRRNRRGYYARRATETILRRRHIFNHEYLQRPEETLTQSS